MSLFFEKLSDEGKRKMCCGNAAAKLDVNGRNSAPSVGWNCTVRGCHPSGNTVDARSPNYGDVDRGSHPYSGGAKWRTLEHSMDYAKRVAVAP
jgi:hypothetical protein